MGYGFFLFFANEVPDRVHALLDGAERQPFLGWDFGRSASPGMRKVPFWHRLQAAASWTWGPFLIPLPQKMRSMMRSPPSQFNMCQREVAIKTAHA